MQTVIHNTKTDLKEVLIMADSSPGGGSASVALLSPSIPDAQNFGGGYTGGQRMDMASPETVGEFAPAQPAGSGDVLAFGANLNDSNTSSAEASPGSGLESLSGAEADSMLLTAHGVGEVATGALIDVTTGLPLDVGETGFDSRDSYTGYQPAVGPAATGVAGSPFRQDEAAGSLAFGQGHV